MDNPTREVNHGSIRTRFFPTPDLNTICIRQIEGDGYDQIEDLIYLPMCDVAEFLRELRTCVYATRSEASKKAKVKDGH